MPLAYKVDLKMDCVDTNPTSWVASHSHLAPHSPSSRHSPNGVADGSLMFGALRVVNDDGVVVEPPPLEAVVQEAHFAAYEKRKEGGIVPKGLLIGVLRIALENGEKRLCEELLGDLHNALPHLRHTVLNTAVLWGFAASGVTAIHVSVAKMLLRWEIEVSSSSSSSSSSTVSSIPISRIYYARKAIQCISESVFLGLIEIKVDPIGCYDDCLFEGVKRPKKRKRVSRESTPLRGAWVYVALVGCVWCAVEPKGRLVGLQKVFDVVRSNGADVQSFAREVLRVVSKYHDLILMGEADETEPSLFQESEETISSDMWNSQAVLHRVERCASGTSSQLITQGTQQGANPTSQSEAAFSAVSFVSSITQ